MDTSHVTVGTAMYMITDCLTYPPKKTPPERGAGAALVPPAIYAAQHERAGRAMVGTATGSTAGLQTGATASGYGHSTRSRPQDSASNRGHRHQEPRKPLAGKRTAPTEAGASQGSRVDPSPKGRLPQLSFFLAVRTAFGRPAV